MQNDPIKLNTVSKWLDRGGAILTGDDYTNSFLDLYLRARVCSSDNKKAVQLLDEKAQHFLKIDSDKFLQLNPDPILRLCDKFIDLSLPLRAVKYLEPFI